jgi:hypothetical protein
VLRARTLSPAMGGVPNLSFKLSVIRCDFGAGTRRNQTETDHTLTT